MTDLQVNRGTDPAAMSIATEIPAAGQVTEILPGILWARAELPFALDHVNIYLIEEEDGWAILDTGVNDSRTRAMFVQLLEGPLKGQRFSRLIATHHHPDHIGLAGWLCKEYDLRLFTSLTAYLETIALLGNPERLGAGFYTDYYRRHGMSAEQARSLEGWPMSYRKLVGTPPPEFTRLLAGDRLKLGHREFEVLTGNGHAPEQLMLYCAAEGILFSADQVLMRISPNVSVGPMEPESDPLGHYLRSLDDLRNRIPFDTLVLPGHHKPFHGIHRRIGELQKQHDQRFETILRACTDTEATVADLVPLLFKRPLDGFQFGFAFGEAHAHANYLLHDEKLGRAHRNDPIRYRSLPR